MEPQEAIKKINEFVRSIKRTSDGMFYIDHDLDLAFDTAIDALEKQIPMKQTEEYDMAGRHIKVCGYCGDFPQGGWDFCSWCGQKQDV